MGAITFENCQVEMLLQMISQLSKTGFPFPNPLSIFHPSPPLPMPAIQEGLWQSVAAAEATVYKPVNQEGLVNHRHQLFPEI